MLHNDLHEIDIYVWNLQHQNAIDKKMYDERVKDLRSNAEFEYIYEIQSNIVITMNHLLSILFYCNTDELQNKFSQTYRRLTEIQESDSKFKARHSHFYHFGKLLRETVEVFGNIMVDEDLTLYHGISQPLFFIKMIAKFFSPTSTTLDRAIAANFAGSLCFLFLRMFATYFCCTQVLMVWCW